MKNHVMADAVRDAYKRGEEDERLEPLVLYGSDGKPVGRIKKGDSVVFYDIRGEREVELTRALTERGFAEFPAEELGLAFATMIEYAKGLDVEVAFPKDGRIPNTLCEVISKRGIRQAKIAESEKACHVTYFLNGKHEDRYSEEDVIIIPSPRGLSTFDQKPEMSVEEMVRTVEEKLDGNKYGFIVANFPNVDVVGHTENKEAIIKAVECVDKAAGEVIEKALKENFTVVLTADHGTVESWLYPDGKIDTGHTRSDVPFIVIEGNDDIRKRLGVRENGTLVDVAPTVLGVMGLEMPEEMTGSSLLLDESYEDGKKVLLLILDGWGINDDDYGNLIKEANTPVVDEFVKEHPSTRLKASGEAVGLPEGTVGNSEVGHLHIGAGRIIKSDRVKIFDAIGDGSYFKNPAFLEVMHLARDNGKALHLLGIVSFYSSHGSIEYAKALLRMAKDEGMREVYIHSMLGRRGEKPGSGALYIEEMEREAEKLGLGKVVSVIGRHWSLDREEHWDRIEKTYGMLVHGKGRKVIE